jgi:RNA polymerase sigma factor (sigma-70 family)
MFRLSRRNRKLLRWAERSLASPTSNGRLARARVIGRQRKSWSTGTRPPSRGCCGGSCDRGPISTTSCKRHSCAWCGDFLRGTPDRPFGHWLLRIATNVGRDYFRRQSVRRRWLAEPGASAPDQAPMEPIDPGMDPAARAAANEVKHVLAQLPPDDRTLLTLHHLEGWGLAQIASQFGWTLTATKLRAWRARRQLRTLLQSRISHERET